MFKMVAVSLVLALLACAPLLRSQEQAAALPGRARQSLAPIALYPDPLLDQILPAAAFPGQIEEAAQLRRAGSAPEDIDAQPWDPSIQAVAHYPTVLELMAGYPEWTAALQRPTQINPMT